MNIQQQITPRPRCLARAAVISAAVVGIIALAPSARAQDPDSQGQVPPAGRMDPRQMVDQRMATLTEALKLDSAQQVGVRWIIAGETMELQELRQNSGGQRSGEDGGGRGGMGGRRGGGGGGRRGGGAPADSTGGGASGGWGGPPEKVRAIRDRADKQIEKLLNPQQLTAYQQLFEQHEARPGGDSTSRRGS